MKTRLLFFCVVTPLGLLGRPLWRLRLSRPRYARSYWRRRGETIRAADLRRRA